MQRALHASLRPTLHPCVAGEAGLRATDVAVYTRTLQMLYSNLTSPTLRKVRPQSPGPCRSLRDWSTLSLGVLASPN